MYRDWPFFRASVDNAALALAKTNLAIRGLLPTCRTAYGPAAPRLLIIREYEQCCDAVPGDDGPAANCWTTRLGSGIRLTVAGPFVNALNLLQIDLLRRLRAVAAKSRRMP